MRKPARILDVLGEIEADVIALQEVDRRFGTRTSTLTAEALDEAGWHYRSVSDAAPSLGWHGNAIIASKKVEIEAVVPITLPAFEPRGAVAALLRFNGVAFAAIGLHLGLLGRHRDQQINAILGYADQELKRPTIIMGDTNEWRGKAAGFARIAQSHIVVPPMPTFHTSLPVLALDRIIVTPEFEPVAHGVHASALAKRASDHLPLWADLVLKNPGSEVAPP